MKRINIENPTFTYDDDDPTGFRSGMQRVGASLGAAQLGTSVYELPPGQAICPYHYEYAEEEWLLVLQGPPTLRHRREATRSSRGTTVRLPDGPRRRAPGAQRTDDRSGC